MSCVFSRSKLEGSDVSNSGSHFLSVTGHFHDHFQDKGHMSTIPEDYHNFMDIFSKSKAAS